MDVKGRGEFVGLKSVMDVIYRQCAFLQLLVWTA